MKVNLPLLGRVKGLANERFVCEAWKRYKGVLCLGFHMPLEYMFRASKVKGSQRTYIGRKAWI
jgi:hypothetical protein